MRSLLSSKLISLIEQQNRHWFLVETTVIDRSRVNILAKTKSTRLTKVKSNWKTRSARALVISQIEGTRYAERVTEREGLHTERVLTSSSPSSQHRPVTSLTQSQRPSFGASHRLQRRLQARSSNLCPMQGLPPQWGRRMMLRDRNWKPPVPSPQGRSHLIQPDHGPHLQADAAQGSGNKRMVMYVASNRTLSNGHQFFFAFGWKIVSSKCCWIQNSSPPSITCLQLRT